MESKSKFVKEVFAEVAAQVKATGKKSSYQFVSVGSQFRVLYCLVLFMRVLGFSWKSYGQYPPDNSTLHKVGLCTWGIDR